MSRVEKTVFISYRHGEQSNLFAGFVNQDLKNHEYDVYYDWESSRPGILDTELVDNIGARAHFLPVLIPSALTRCHDPSDLLRLEIETALDTKRSIVPLMFKKFNFDSPAIRKQLDGTPLAPIAKYIGVEFGKRAEEGMDRLRRNFLEAAIDVVLHPVSESKLGRIRLGKRLGIRPLSEATNDDMSALLSFEEGFVATDPAEKAHFYTEAIRLKPNFVEAFVNRAEARFEMANTRGAAEDFIKVTRLDPSFAMRRTDLQFKYAKNLDVSQWLGKTDVVGVGKAKSQQQLVEGVKARNFDLGKTGFEPAAKDFKFKP